MLGVEITKKKNKKFKKDSRVKDKSQVSGINNWMEGKTTYKMEKAGGRALFIRKG